MWLSWVTIPKVTQEKPFRVVLNIIHELHKIACLRIYLTLLLRCQFMSIRRLGVLSRRPDKRGVASSHGTVHPIIQDPKKNWRWAPSCPSSEWWWAPLVKVPTISVGLDGAATTSADSWGIQRAIYVFVSLSFFFWGGVSGWLWCFFFIFHSTDDLRDGQHAYKDMTWTYLDGEVKRSFAPFGTVWILRTPLKHVITWVRQVEMESKRRKRTQDWNILEPCLALRVCFQMQHDPPQTHYFLLSYSRLSSL